MKKILKKLMVMFSCATLCITTFVSCGFGDGDENEKVDNTKAQLYISNFDGGVGTEWLYAAKDRFIEKYKDYSFTPGTKGVQIWIKKHKSSGVATAEKMSMEREEIYFLENCNYYDMLSSGKLYDITEYVTSNLTEFGENKSIEDKLSNEYKSYFKTSNNKYYGIPHYKSVYSITFDKDLFDSKKLYRSSTGSISKKSTDTGLSNGADGVPGTYDDGLPATYAEFYELCQTMQTRGVDPLMWTYGYKFYTTSLLAALKADYEGSEAHLMYDFNGTSTKLVDSIDSNGVVTLKPSTQITSNNGYEIYNTAGTYYALSFLDKIISNGYYADGAFNEAYSQTDVQKLFLLSKLIASSTKNPMGMFVEGCWWPHEATSAFQQAKEAFPREKTSLDERNLALMPYPKATTEQVGSGQTILDVSNSLACINANIASEKVELATTFLRFLETEESLVEFLKTTNMIRGYDFTVSEETYNSLNTFAKSVVDVVKNSNCVLPLSSSSLFYNNYTAFGYLKPFSTEYADAPVEALFNGKSALEIFNKAKVKYNQTTWNVLQK